MQVCRHASERVGLPVDWGAVQLSRFIAMNSKGENVGLLDTSTSSVPLDINYKKTCDCKSFHINCLTAKEWLKCQIGVWEFYYEGRDIRDKELHPAVFPISMASKVISLFTHQGELVIDPFVGSGTTLVAARDLDRNAVGFDLNEEYIGLCEERLLQLALGNESKQLAIADDARNIPNYFENETVSLIFTSPLTRKGRNNADKRISGGRHLSYLSSNNAGSVRV